MTWRPGLQEKFGVKVNKSQWFELDSSSDAKYSRHLILLTPDFCFKSNLHAGCFVEEMIGKISSETQQDQLWIFKVRILNSY